jgi:hypothetical protein
MRKQPITVQRNGAAKRWTILGTPGLHLWFNMASPCSDMFHFGFALIPKNKISPSPKRDGLTDRTNVQVRSDFGNGDSAFRANFNAGLATQTFVCVHRLGFAILHLENLRRTSIDTFFITGTLIFIDHDLPHDTTSKVKNLRAKKRCYCNLDYKVKQHAKVVFL